MSAFEVTELTYHGPGWEIKPSETRDYIVWAPRPDDGSTKGRAYWAASWSRRNGWDGSHKRAATLAEALAVFPNDAEGRRARRLLLAAGESWQAGDA